MNTIIHDGLQEEAKQILSMLENINTPLGGLDYFTVGDHFRSSILKLKKEILKTSSQPKPLEKLVIGDYGAGKTHFISYLHWLLLRDAPPGSIVSRVDLSRILDKHEFEFRVIQGMKLVDQSNGHREIVNHYPEVLRSAYESVRDRFMTQDGKSREEIEKFYANLILLLLGAVGSPVSLKDLLEVFRDRPFFKQLLREFSGQTQQALYERAIQESSQEDTKFVQNYLKIIKKPEVAVTDFEPSAKQLSKEGKLTDVIFRILKYSGINLVVVLVDELESLVRKLGRDQAMTCLETIRNFHSSLNRIGAENGYPSMAFVVTCTPNFFDELQTLNTPLYQRWLNRTGNKHIVLQSFSFADIDNLIFKLRELFYLAGYHLRPAQCASSGFKHEVIELRQQWLDYQQNQSKPQTTRDLMIFLIDKIRKTWIEPL
ncbi:BREX system ATP-binding domain-containing protein [Moorena sp. SIO3I6]|uniref:BREX system ATP-binding domain-containing protein n=1 Tax=Moorena sp. SIO3I6 TaxID=2607831 RepID=UPI0013F74E9F|nr:BREX system ATP-binding domain-containing protein [Moorena sp. SIO3I6]NEP23862.1 hypothetical protein [Moorena sp. SIO3I6]